MTVLRLREVAPADWPALAAGFSDLHYEQSLAYAVPAAARLGARARFLVLERDGAPVAGAVTRIKAVPGLGRGIAWIASGPFCQPCGGVAPDRETRAAILEALREELADRQGHILRLRPPALPPEDPADWAAAAQAAGFAPTGRANSYRSFAFDLAQDEEALMMASSGSWRRHLRAAMRAGLEVERGRPGERELGARFRALYDEMRGFKAFGESIAPEFFFGLDGPDFGCEVLMARKGGRDVAAVVAGDAGESSVYLFGATGAAGRELRAGYLLAWEGALRAKAAGLAWYDLGGVDEAENPEGFRFKSRAGGVEIVAAGPFEARPGGPLPRLVTGLEGLRARLKGRGR
jgi:hypothetical protein